MNAAVTGRRAWPGIVVAGALAVTGGAALGLRGGVRPAPAIDLEAAPRDEAAVARRSLDALTEQLFRDRSELLKKGPQAVYDRYSQPAKLAFSGAEADYFTALAGLARGRSNTGPAQVQHFDRSLLPDVRAEGADRLSVYASWAAQRARSETTTSDRSTSRAYGQLREAFFFFHRGEGRDGEPVRRRVYVNPRPDAALAVTAALVTGVLDQPARHPGVASLKVAGPGAIGLRADGIVVYTSSAEAGAGVVDALAAHRRAHPEHFADAVPFMTARLAPGVAVGDEPPGLVGDRASFGSLRSELLFRALELSAEGDLATFRCRVDALFAANLLDPRAPHRNLGRLPGSGAAPAPPPCPGP